MNSQFIIRIKRRNYLTIIMLVLTLVATGLLAISTSAMSPDLQDDDSKIDRNNVSFPTDQIIIQYKPEAGVRSEQDARKPERLEALRQVTGVELTYFREMSGDAHVLKLPQAMADADVAIIASKIAMLPEVEYAEPDSIMLPTEEPNDPSYGSQWHYFATNGVNLPAAWDITTGSSNVRIAVIDTGALLTHPDINARFVGGYDFISSPTTANDGNGRDNDPADPGDWVPAGFCGTGSPAENSSWHGTHVAGTIGAATNNSLGVAGINWVASIVPIRVLGRCGGSTSDVIDGMRWAAGISVPGVPTNANPSKILNMSLGARATCPTSYQNAIDDVRATGGVIIVAAGNDNENVSNHTPSNCNGVIAVAAIDQQGNRSIWDQVPPITSGSNFGDLVDISAPGTAVLSTSNDGTQAPTTHSYRAYNGTSMATPHVAGIASLVWATRPNLTPDQMEALLTGSVKPFPSGSTCNTDICGTGIIDAYEAVRDIFVDLNNTGPEDGSSANPYDTVSEGVNAVHPWGIVRIAAGTYTDTPITISQPMELHKNSGSGIVTIGP